jgi:AcrR family transcriptional regulator
MTNATRLDGRVRRGERNRDAIAEALLALLEAGEVQPTARAVAAEAGVSLRTVFQHFDDMESLYAVCIETQFTRNRALYQPVDPALEFDARVRALVTQRARFYERVAPIRRATLQVAHTSPVLQRALATNAAGQRRELASLFERELAGKQRRDRLAAVEVATSFDAWDHLRRVQSVSVASAERVVVRLVRAALGEDS